MTIHKSKGLEFEVVLVPDLHVRGGNNKPELLSWLERGIAEPDESDDLTEFLVAPLQFKGDDRGKARQWVDRLAANANRRRRAAFSMSPPLVRAKSCIFSPNPPTRSRMMGHGLCRNRAIACSQQHGRH